MRVAIVGCDPATARVHGAAAAVAGPCTIVAVAHVDSRVADAVAAALRLPWDTPRFNDTDTMVTALLSPSGEEAVGLDAAVVGSSGAQRVADLEPLWAADMPALLLSPPPTQGDPLRALLARIGPDTAARLACVGDVAGGDASRVAASHAEFRCGVESNSRFGAPPAKL